MNEKLIAFRVGVVILAAATLAFGLIGIFSGGTGVFKSRYTVYLKFPSAPNVTVDTPVRKNGVLIGRVTNVELYDDYVELSVGIDAERKLRKSEVCRISTASLVSGDAVLEFVPSSDKPRSEEFVNDLEWMADGIVANDPFQVFANMQGDVEATMASFRVAADGVATLTQQLNKTLGDNDGQLERMMAKSEQTLDSVEGAMTNFNDIFGDPKVKDSVKQFVTDLPGTVDNFNQLLERGNDTMASMESVSKKAEQNLDNISAFTEAIGEKGPQILNDLAQTTESLEELMSQASIFAESLNNPHGTLGKLINDREMYDDVRETVGILKDAARRIEPILRDVRIGTDKFATDPGGLLKRVLDPKPIGVGLKYSGRGIQLDSDRERHRTPAGSGN